MAFSLGGMVCTCCGPPGTTTSGCHTSCSCVNIPDLIHLTDSVLGISVDAAFNSVSGVWEATATYSYPGGPGDFGSGATCPARVVTLNVRFDTACRMNIFWKADTVSLCPNDAGPQTPSLLQTLIASSCTPWTASQTQTVSGTPGGHPSGAAQVLLGYPYAETYTGTAPYSSTDCCVFDNVKGCNAAGVPGAIVQYWTNGGKTTSVAGPNTTVGIGAQSNLHSAGTYWREISCTRFVTDAQSVAAVCGQSPLTTLTVATGYRCILTCAFPISETLNAFHPIFGAIVYTYSGGNWVSVVSYSFLAFNGCAAKTVTVTCTWNGASVYTEVWKVDGSNCPDNAGATTHTATWSRNFLTCYVPSSASFDVQFGIFPSNTADNNMYFFGGQQVDLTE